MSGGAMVAWIPFFPFNHSGTPVNRQLIIMKYYFLFLALFILKDRYAA